MNQASGEDKNLQRGEGYLFDFGQVSEKKEEVRREKSEKPSKAQAGSFVSQQLVELADRVNQFLIDIVNLKYELLQEKKGKEEILKKYEELREKYDELDGLVQSGKQEIQLLNSRLRSLELQNHTLSVQISEKEEQLQEERIAKQRIFELLSEREARLAELNAKLVEKEKDVEGLEKKLQKLTGELSNALITIANLEETKRELNEKVNLYENKLKGVRDALEEKDELVERIREENTHLTSELNSLQELVEAQQSVVDSLSKEKEKLLDKIKILEKELNLKKLEFEKEASKRKLLEARQEEVLKESARLIEKIDSLSKEKDKYERELRSSREKELKLQDAVNYWKSQVTQLKIDFQQTFEGEMLKQKSIDKKLFLAYYSLPESERNLLNLLICAGFLSEEQRKKIQGMVDFSNVNLGNYLIESGIASEEVVYISLSVLNNIPYLYLQTEDVDSAMLSFLGLDYCIKRLIVPLKGKSENLLVAMADPTNTRILEEVGRKANRRVLAVYSFPSAIVGILEEYLTENK